MHPAPEQSLLTIEQSTAHVERKIITSMIVSDRFMREIIPDLDIKDFTSPFTQTVAGWCQEHFEEFGTAPKGKIEDIFHWHNQNGLNPEIAPLIVKFLKGISDEHQGDLDIDFTLSQARSYFQKRKLARLKDDLDPNNPERALKALQRTLDQAAKVQIEAYDGDLFIVTSGQEDRQALEEIGCGGRVINSPDLTRLKTKHITLVNPDEALEDRFKARAGEFGSLQVVQVDFALADDKAGKMHIRLALNNPNLPDLSLTAIEKALGHYTMTFDDLLHEHFPLRQPLCGPFMERSVSLIISAPGYGKSWLSLEIAAAVASGRPAMMGLWEVPRKARVLYIDGEMDPGDLRFRGWLTKAGVACLLSKSILEAAGVTTQLELTNPEVRDLLMRLITRGGYELVILDNFYSLLGTHDLSSANDWMPINTWMNRLKAKGVSVIGDHHTSKDEGNPFGTISREFNADLVLVLNSPEERDGDLCQFTIRVKKNRQRYPGLEGMRYECKDGVWTVEEDKKEAQELLKLQVAKMTHEGKALADIAREVNRKPARVSQVRSGLVNDGWFIAEGATKNRKFSITETGLKMISDVGAVS